MEKHLELNDADFEKQFENAEIHPAIFSHEAHLRLAWIHIVKYGLESALQKIQAQLFHFVNTVGAKDKYNKTLTIAAVKAVHHFVQKSKSTSFESFIGEFPQLKNNFKGLMASHYTNDIFNSEEAKIEYLEPDLLPFN